MFVLGKLGVRKDGKTFGSKTKDRCGSGEGAIWLLYTLKWWLIGQGAPSDRK